MAAEKVQQGQTIKAKQLNDVIDSVSIHQPSGESPFRVTSQGTLVNGGSVYVTKAPSKYEPVFNITYGAGKLSEQFESESGYFNGIWVQLADWQSPDLYLYHSTFFANPVSLFVIDPTAEDGKLVWLVGDLGKQGKWPLCQASKSAGIAVFQVFEDEAGSSGTAYNGSCCIVMGDFTKFGAESGVRPDLGPNAYDVYLDAIKTAAQGAFFSSMTSIACRHSAAMYSREDDLEIGVNTVPVAYTVGSQHIESIPDRDQAANSVGKDVLLSSLEFTPSKQYNIAFSTPTFSYSLYNFDRMECDYSTIEELSAANDLSGNPPSEHPLSAFDVLVRHKQEHPLAQLGGPASTQAMARLEYLSLSSLIPDVGTVDSNLSALQLSSIQEKTYEDAETGEKTTYHQLYKFDQVGLGAFSLSDQNEFEFVVRDWCTTGGNGAIVNYLNLSTLTDALSSEVISVIIEDPTILSAAVKVDSEDGGLSSISHDEQGRLELYKFSTAGVRQQLSSDDIVVRGADGKVHYVKLEQQALSGEVLSGDSQIEEVMLSSVEVHNLDDVDYIQLFKFDDTNYSLTPQQVADNVWGESYDEVLIRSGNILKYGPMYGLLPVDVDTGKQYSIEKSTVDGAKALQLYNFDEGTDTGDRNLRVTLSYDGRAHYFRGDNGADTSEDTSNKVVVKHDFGQGNEIEYDNLMIVAPRISAGDIYNLTEEISATVVNMDISAVVDLSGLSAELSNVFWTQGGNYNDTCWGNSIGDSTKTRVFDLNYRTARDANDNIRISWETTTQLRDASNNVILYAGNYAGTQMRGLFNRNGAQTVDFHGETLIDPTKGATLDWNNRQLVGPWSITGGGASLTIGSTTINESQLQQLLALLNNP